MPLRIHSQLPAGLLDCEASQLHDHLGGPALIRVPGATQPALFVSVLLHGNETSGWDGVRSYLRANPSPPRDLALFIGNTAAAREGLRVLPSQVDFNRIWRDADGESGALATMLLEAIEGESFFAAIDLHNNTGHNPYYSVLTELEPHNLGLAYLFSDKAVYIEEPDTVLTRVFSDRCPAIALEVGPVGDERCVGRVADYVERCMSLDQVPEADPDMFSLFRTRVRVHVRDDVAFGFEGEESTAAAELPLMLTGGMEAVNFHELPAGSVFGASSMDVLQVLQVLDTNHDDVTAGFFEQSGTEILLKTSVVPAMYTTDPYVVRQDCLCYFMERLQL